MSLTSMTVGVIISAIDRASAPIRQIQGATSTLGRALESVSSKAALAGAALHGVALATASLSDRMKQVGLHAVQAFAAFDDARALIASMPGVTREALDAIEQRAFAFTRTNKATLQDYYDTAYNILSAGIPEALTAYATEVSIKVGQATRGSTAEAGEAVAILYNNMRNATRDAGEELARMGDILTATQQRFQLKNLAQLTEGLKYATPAAKTARLAVDDMNAALGRLNSAGLQGSMAGTALANLLANRFKAAKEIGFKVAVKKGSGELDLLRTLENLRAVIGDIEHLSPQMEDKLRKGFGDEGFRAVMLLLGQTEQLKEDLEAIRHSAGSAERASQIINQSAGARWQQMINRIEQMWIRLGQALEPLKDAIASHVLSVVDAIDGLIARFPTLTKWVVGGLAALSSLAAAAGTALVAIGALGKLRTIKQWLFGGKTKGGGGGIAGAAAEALGGGVQKVWVVNMPGAIGGVPDLSGKMGTGGSQAARTLGARLRSLVAGVTMQAQLAWQHILAWGGRVREVATLAWGALASGAQAAGRAILWLGRAVMLHPVGLILTAIAGAAYLIWRNWDAIGPRLAAVWQTVKAAFAAAWSWIAALPGRMLEMGRQIIDGLLAGLRARWEAIQKSIAGLAASVRDAFASALGIRSPSRVFAELGGHLMDGLAMGIEGEAAQPLSAMRGVASALAAPLAAGAMSLAPPAIAAPPIEMPQPPAIAAPHTEMPRPPAIAAAQPGAPSAQGAIHITVNLNGPATPQAAQDVAAAVRREVERVLAEQTRRQALERRAAMIDGGL